MKYGENKIMDAYEFHDFIVNYLPVNYRNKNNNYYQEYLLGSLTLCWEKEKYQFVLLTANILFMTIVFKDFWFDDKVLKETITLDAQLPQSYYKNAINYFGLSKYNEKIFLRSYLKYLAFDDNDIKNTLHLIDHRDHCAHACGKIYYGREKVAGFLDLYAEAIKEISDARKSKVLTSVKNNYDEHVSSTHEIKSFVEKLVYDYNLSFSEFYDVKRMFDLNNFIDCREQLNQILTKYYMGVIVSNYCELEEPEQQFETDLGALIDLNEEKKEEIAEIVERDLELNGLDKFNILKYETIRAIFSRENSSIAAAISDHRNVFNIELQGKTADDIKCFIAYLQSKLGELG